MATLEIVGIILVLVAIIYAFIKGKDKLGMALIIVLLALLYILDKSGVLNIF